MKSRLVLTVYIIVQLKLRKNIHMDKICKHQQLFDSRDAVVPPLYTAHRVCTSVLSFLMISLHFFEMIFMLVHIESEH